MGTNEMVTTARRRLRRVGVLLPNVPFAPQPSVEEQRDAVRRIEGSGFGSVWINEGVGGKDVFTQAAILLAATDGLTVATGVANMFARPPETTHGASSYLADAFPGRFALGLGVGYPFQAQIVGQTFARPAARARTYLERMRVVPEITPALGAAYPTVLAANGPKMLAVAREHADGVLPAMQPPAFTTRARQVLGPDQLVVVGLATVLDDDRDRARATARTLLARITGLEYSPYADGLRRLGYTDADLSGPSARLLEQTVAFGTPEDIAARVRAHLDAGADHVRLDLDVSDFAGGIDLAERLGDLAALI